MGSRRTLRAAGRRFGVGLLLFSLLGILGLWWSSRNSASERTVQQARAPSSEAHSPRKPSRSRSPLFVIRHLGDRQRANFAVFRTSPEPLPWSMRRAMRRPIYGINWDLAQRLPISVPAHAWAVPGDGYICILSLQVHRGRGAVGATCASTEAALDHGLATTLLSDRGTGAFQRSYRVIVGIAPDRARGVIAVGSGSTVSIAVGDGVFIQRDTVPYPPDRLRLVDRREGA
jgi:hypothetical protein